MFKIYEEEYNGHKFKSIYIVIDKIEYRLGTLKQYKDLYYIQTKAKKIIDK